MRGVSFGRLALLVTAAAASPSAILSGAALAQGVPATQMPAYIQLQRDVIINADLWTDTPQILAANYGFEGIIGVPGLQNASDLALAIAAGAGVNLDWAALDPVPPLRNLTSAAGQLGVAAAGFGGVTLLADAMPIEVSWPLLPSSVAPERIAITLNTGQVVTPQLAALNPNYDHNERHVIVVFGQFGNRLSPGTPGAVYPVQVSFIDADGALMGVGPNGPVPLTGLSAPSSNPYLAGPSLVGARLNRFSPVGDFAPPALAGASPNDAYSLYGQDAQYRLRLFTTGGFSPDGVSGLLPNDFETFFRLHAVDADGNPVVIDRSGQVYDLGVGTVQVVGLAEVGAPDPAPDRAYYVEDHDNYFDIVLKGDEAAIRLLRWVEIPTSAEGYSDIYNPGGPGRTPVPGTTYTKPALRQFQPVDFGLDGSRTVSYAAQDVAAYDQADDLPIVFRMRPASGPDRLTASSNEAVALLASGYSFAGVDYANETARPGVSDVDAYVSAANGDRIYTLDPAEQAQLAADAGWTAEGRAFGAFAFAVPGGSAVYRFYDPATGWHIFSSDLGAGLQKDGVLYQGIGWYSGTFLPALPAEVRFDRSDDVTLADPISSTAALTKAGSGTLTLAGAASFAQGTTVTAGRLAVNGSLAGGTVTVSAGGTLGGSGTIGAATTVSGTLAPGNSPGLLTFTAPVTMTPGSTLQVEVDGPAAAADAGGYDRVLLLGAGSSFAAAGTLEVRLRGISPPASNDFTPVLGQRFAGIVTAQGGVTGAFDGLAQPAAGLPAGTRMDAIYNAQSIDLVVTPASYADLPAAGVAVNANQAAVGAALQAVRPAAGVRPTGAAADLFPALAPLSAGQIGPALDSLTGQIHADALDVAAAGQRMVQGLVAGRLAASRMAPPAAPGGVAGSVWHGGWGEALGGTGEQGSVDGISGHDWRQRGVAVGADASLAQGWRLGAALGRLDSHVGADNGSADIGSTFLAVYGGRRFGAWDLTGHLLGSLDEYDSSRAVRVGSFASDPTGEAGGWGIGGGLALGRSFALGRSLGRSFAGGGSFALEPSVGLGFGRLHRDGFTESGGASAALAVEAADRSSLRSRLGAGLTYRDGPVAAGLSLAWNHEFLDEAAASRASLAGASFETSAAAPGRDSAELGAGLRVAMAEGMDLTAAYRLAAGSAVREHAGTVGLRISW